MVDHSSSKASEEPCSHQQHDFKQEIEDSIRRCEELLSMAPMSYQPPDGKSSGRKSSRSTVSASRRSDGRSDVETVCSSASESDRKSAEVDPEWKKNMGLLINRQDGAVPNVSPRGATPRAAPASPRVLREREIHHVYASGDDSCPQEHSGQQQHHPVEEYNFSFDGSRNSSHEENVEQSISIRTRTVLHETDEPGYSGSDDWAYERLGQASTPSTKTSHSELNSKADHESERRAFAEPLDSSELETFNDYSRYPESHQVEERMEQRQQPAAEVGGFKGDRSLDHGSVDAQTFQMTIAGECQLHTTPATFPRSVKSSRSSHPNRSPGRSPPNSPPPRSPKASGTNRVASSTAKNNSQRINDNSMSFSFTIHNQPKYAEDWEWLEECKGIDAGYQDDVAQQPTTAATEIVLEGGRMRIGPAKVIKSDLKRFKVQKKFRSQLDAMNSKKGGKSPNRMGHQVHVLRTQEQSGKQAGPIPARLRNLSKPRTDLYQKFAHTRAQLEEEHMSECSFRPKVGRRPKPHSQYSAPLIQRVGGIEQRVDLRKRARKVIEKEEVDQCSFWPQINSNSEWIDPARYKPIEERAMDYQRRKEAKLARARAKEDMDMGLTFRPEINPKSVKIFKQTGLEELNLEDRLTTAGSLHQDRKSKEMKGTPKNECTFSPEINGNTDLIMRSSKLFEGCTPDFLSRQKYCMQVRELKQREKQQKFQTETLTFRPKTGNSDAILKDSPIAEMFDQSVYKRVERLYHRDTERRQHIRQKISDAYYAQFSHQPEIDETSRLLGRSASLRDLYKNEKGKYLKEQMRTSMEQSFAKEHPFHPKLVSRSPRRACDERMENVLHRRRQFRLEKARVLEEMKVIRELQEFKECTFKPVVNRLPPKDKEPVVVKGLGRHLELQDLAKQMKRDQEEWERKIFFQHVYSLPKRQYTIPKPFSLCAGRRSKIRQEPVDNDGGCVVQFKFQDRDPGIDLTTKKGPSMNTFYDASHPSPANQKWRDNTIWPSPTEQPRFKHPSKEPAFDS